MKQIIPVSKDLKSVDGFCQSMIARNRLTILNHMFLKIKVKLFSFLLVFVLFLLNIPNSKCQSIVWERAIGGNHEDYGYAIETDDSGYVYIAGSTSTNLNGDIQSTCFTGTIQNPWLTKLDSTGNLIWSKCMGLDGEIESMHRINDHEFIVTGWLGSSTGNGTTDMWIAKIDTSGNFGNHNFIYGSPNSYEFGYGVCQSGYNMYLAVGRSNDSLGHGDYDMYLSITDSCCALSYVYGGSGYDQGHSIIRLHDGNYFLLGSTFSNDGDVTNNHGSGDVWGVKIDSTGNILWQKTFGGSGWDAGFGATEYNNDIYITGWTESNDGDLTNNYGQSDGWIFKIDSIGNMIWQKNIGGSLNDVIYSSPIIIDDRILIGASTPSNDFDVIDQHSVASPDFWIVQMDTSGNILQANCFGGSGSDVLFDLKLKNSKIITAGRTESDDGDITNYHFSPTYVNDAWALVLDSNIILSNKKSINNNTGIYVGPNPVYNILEIRNNNLINHTNSNYMKLFDCMNTLIQSRKFNEFPLVLDLDYLKSGIYILYVNNFYFKIIKI